MSNIVWFPETDDATTLQWRLTVNNLITSPPHSTLTYPNFRTWIFPIIGQCIPPESRIKFTTMLQARFAGQCKSLDGKLSLSAAIKELVMTVTLTLGVKAWEITSSSHPLMVMKKMADCYDLSVRHGSWKILTPYDEMTQMARAATAQQIEMFAYGAWTALGQRRETMPAGMVYFVVDKIGGAVEPSTDELITWGRFLVLLKSQSELAEPEVAKQPVASTPSTEPAEPAEPAGPQWRRVKVKRPKAVVERRKQLRAFRRRDV